MVVGGVGKETVAEVAVKLLGRQPVPGKVRCHQNPEACRCLSQVIQSLLRTRVTGARIAMAAQENRILTRFLITLLNCAHAWLWYLY